MTAAVPGVRDQLAAALTDDVIVPVERGPVLDVLLPVVERLRREAAAETLEALAKQVRELASGPVPAIDSAFDTVVIARARADEHRAAALHPSGGQP